MTATKFTIKCARCHTRMQWFATGPKSGYWRCPKCPRTTGGTGHEWQHNEEREREDWLEKEARQQ